jgi:hypothetical protein
VAAVSKCECGADFPHHLADLGLTEHTCSCGRTYSIDAGTFTVTGDNPKWKAFCDAESAGEEP